jgi:DNA-binding GntR family transcriptional regulator
MSDMLKRVDTTRAYQQLFELITTLQLKPKQVLDPAQLSLDLDTAEHAVREALQLLSYDELLVIEDDRMAVAEIRMQDLTGLSELRLLLEPYSAKLAAERRAPDDLAVMEALRVESSRLQDSDAVSLFELDSKFHRAIARAARNKYLQRSLDRYYGLSRRLWFLVLPELEFLPSAVSEHVGLLQAIREGDPSQAETLMHSHVQSFYKRVEQILERFSGDD